MKRRFFLAWSRHTQERAREEKQVFWLFLRNPDLTVVYGVFWSFGELHVLRAAPG